MKFTTENEEKINIDFANLCGKFKPEFGNENHLSLLELLDRITKSRKSLDKLRENATVQLTKSYRKKRFDLKVRAVNQLSFLIKQERKNYE